MPVHTHTRFALIAICTVGILFAGRAHGGEYEWNNFPRIPLPNPDAWSVARIEHEDFESFRIAADDFILTEKTRITKIVYFGVELGNPPFTGFGDWYVFAVDKEGAPGELVAVGNTVRMEHVEASWKDPNFGQVYENRFAPDDLVLDAGHYFLAFRTFQDFDPNGKNTSGALSTREWTNGESRAYWNFGVLADGTVTQAWQELQVFNGSSTNEWSFFMSGRTESSNKGDLNCDGSIDLVDVGPFILALLDPEGYAQEYPDCDINHGDTNDDGSVDLSDVAPFIELLIGP